MLLWALAVPFAAGLAVVALQSAGGPAAEDVVISAPQALALAGSPAAQPPTATPTPTPEKTTRPKESTTGSRTPAGTPNPSPPDGEAPVTDQQRAPRDSAGTQAPTPRPTPARTPRPSPPPADDVVQRRVTGAVLGLRCAAGRVDLVWSVPDDGWRVDEVEREERGLKVRLEADEREVTVTIACRQGVPTVVAAERDEGESGGD